jgi:hypothetical protein
MVLRWLNEVIAVGGMPWVAQAAPTRLTWGALDRSFVGLQCPIPHPTTATLRAEGTMRPHIAHGRVWLLVGFVALGTLVGTNLSTLMGLAGITTGTPEAPSNQSSSAAGTWGTPFFPDQYAAGTTVGNNPNHNDCPAIQRAIDAASAPSPSNPALPVGHVQLRVATTYYCASGSSLKLRSHTYISAEDHTSIVQFQGVMGPYLENDTRGMQLRANTTAGSNELTATSGSFSPLDVGHPAWITDPAHAHGGLITTITAISSPTVADVSDQAMPSQTAASIVTTRGNVDIRLHNFAIRGAGSGFPAGPNSQLPAGLASGIVLDYVRGLRIEHLEISMTPLAGIFYTGCQNVDISGNWVHNTGRDGITGFGRIDDLKHIRVGYNLIERNGDDAIAINGSMRPFSGRPGAPRVIYFQPDGQGADDIRIDYNTIKEWTTNVNGLAMGRDIHLDGVTNAQVSYNNINYGDQSAIQVRPGATATSSMPDGSERRSTNLVITDNIIANAGQTDPGSILWDNPPGYALDLTGITTATIAFNTSMHSRMRGLRETDCVACSLWGNRLN